MGQTTDFAILGILTHGAQSGYDIKKHISGSIGYFWQESYGQLYPALRKMVKQGLLTMYVEKNEGKPDKKIYQITPTGRESLQSWLKKPIESIPKLRHELLLKLFFGIESTPQINMNHVSEYKAKCSAYLEELKQIKSIIEKENESPARIYWLITISNGEHCLGAEIAWCNETLITLSKEK
jgi:DNA-binding PadR family transcriptional regulator